jgi:hypothetical protein
MILHFYFKIPHLAYNILYELLFKIIKLFLHKFVIKINRLC